MKQETISNIDNKTSLIVDFKNKTVTLNKDEIKILSEAILNLMGKPDAMESMSYLKSLDLATKLSIFSKAFNDGEESQNGNQSNQER